MKETRISFRATPREQEAWKAAAKVHGLTATDFYKKAINFMSGFDLDFLNLMARKSNRLQVPDYLYLQNTVIKRWAQDAAEVLAYDDPVRKVMDEFIHDQDGVITGKRLFGMLRGNYAKHLKQEAALIEVERSNLEKTGRVETEPGLSDEVEQAKTGVKWGEIDITKLREDT